MMTPFVNERGWSGPSYDLSTSITFAFCRNAIPATSAAWAKHSWNLVCLVATITLNSRLRTLRLVACGLSGQASESGGDKSVVV